jgi:hypothetical protein
MNALIPSADNLAINGGMNKMSEELLVSAAKPGDAVAVVELSKRHSNKILRRVYRTLKIGKMRRMTWFHAGCMLSQFIDGMRSSIKPKAW